jgi:hypothetical protein
MVKNTKVVKHINSNAFYRLQSIEKELKNIKLNLLAIHQLFIDMESHSLSVLENSAGAMKVYNKSVEDFTKLGVIIIFPFKRNGLSINFSVF